MLFLSGMILVTNAFGLKRSGRVANVEKDLELASKAVEMMRSLQYEYVVLARVTHYRSLMEHLTSRVHVSEPLASVHLSFPHRYAL